MCLRRIFCHSGNQFGNLDEINEDRIEAPQVPTGMTGGVESEAMIYCVRSTPSLPILLADAQSLRRWPSSASSTP